jgi:hypothetical protein
LYPLAQGVFAADTSGSVSSLDARDAETHVRAVLDESSANEPKPLGPLLVRRLVYEESLPYTLMIPLRVFFEGEDDNPKYFDGRLHPLLLLLPLVLLLIAKKTSFRYREQAVFAVYSVLMVLLVFLLTDMRVRWIATIVPPLVVLATYSLAAIYELLSKRFGPGAVANAVVGLLIAAYFVPNLAYAHALFHKIDPLPYVTGKIDYATYVSQHRSEYPAIALANEVVPAGRKVLGLYLGNRRYYFTADAIAVNKVFTSIAEQSSSGDAIADRLLELGYSHIVVHTGLFRQWLTSTDKATAERVDAFTNTRLEELLFEGGFGLYEITPREAAPASSNL